MLLHLVKICDTHTGTKKVISKAKQSEEVRNGKYYNLKRVAGCCILFIASATADVVVVVVVVVVGSAVYLPNSHSGRPAPPQRELASLSLGRAPVRSSPHLHSTIP